MAVITTCDDYATSIQIPQFLKPQKLSGGSPEMNGIRPVMYTGGFCVVFPYKSCHGKYAVRCWHAQVEGAQERMRRISEFLETANLPYFVDFQYYDQGINTSQGVLPIVVMDWVDAKPLKHYIQGILHNQSALNNLADNFMQMIKDLHEKGISHGDLQHGNIMVKSDGKLVLVDYDSMYVPSLHGYSSATSGLWGYQHPARFSYKTVTPKADYFSELVIYTSIKALATFPDLWQKLQMEDTDTLIFSKEDIESGGKSQIFTDISKDAYLKQLVTEVRSELSKTSIETLLPLEQLEPVEKEKLSRAKEEEEIQNLLSQIREVLDSLSDDASVGAERDWLQKVNIQTISLSEVLKHYDVALFLKKKSEDRAKRAQLIDELRAEYMDNGYVKEPTKVDSSSAINDMRSEWGN